MVRPSTFPVALYCQSLTDLNASQKHFLILIFFSGIPEEKQNHKTKFKKSFLVLSSLLCFVGPSASWSGKTASSTYKLSEMRAFIPHKLISSFEATTRDLSVFIVSLCAQNREMD